MYDRKTFFSYARKAPFGNRLTQQQVGGMEAILKEWEATRRNCDIRWLAYILATSFHETGGRMVAVREGFAKTDKEARRIVANRTYGKPHPETGHVYYGRGHVQLTWAENYERMGYIIHKPLLENPDLALDEKVSVKILIEGMLRGASGRGDFTGKALEHYFNKAADDPVGARRIVNGTDKARLIAGYYTHFLDALKEARDAHTFDRTPPEVTEESAKPDGGSLLTDKATIGTALAGGGGIGASLLGAINNPWGLIAFVVLAGIIAGGTYLFVTGRIEIKKKAGA